MKTKLILALAGGLLLPSCVEHYATATGNDPASPGSTVSSLPPGHIVERVNGVDYYRSNNVYYRPEKNSYTVVASPHGGRTYGQQSFSDRGSRADRAPGARGSAVMRRLPRGSTVQTVRGTQYHVHQGTYYLPQNGGYVVVEQPR